jgi:hypothetical protein
MRTSRRNFISTAVTGSMAVAGAGLTGFHPAEDQKKKPASRSDKLKRMASNSYAVNALFKRRANPQQGSCPTLSAIISF